MSGVAAARPVKVVAEAGHDDDDRLERVRALLRPEFVAEVWDADGQVFAPPRDHPLLGLRKCAVDDCEAGVRTPGVDLCGLCIPRFKASGLTLEQFAAIPTDRITKGERFCRVPGCPRPSHLRNLLCQAHYCQWQDQGRPPVEEFVPSSRRKPLASLGPCIVVSCSRRAARLTKMCNAHTRHWESVFRSDLGADLQRWLRIAEPIGLDHIVIFKGLAGRVQMELLLGLQVRTDAGVRTSVSALRVITAALRTRCWKQSAAAPPETGAVSGEVSPLRSSSSFLVCS